MIHSLKHCFPYTDIFVPVSLNICTDSHILIFYFCFHYWKWVKSYFTAGLHIHSHARTHPNKLETNPAVNSSSSLWTLYESKYECEMEEGLLLVFPCREDSRLNFWRESIQSSRIFYTSTPIFRESLQSSLTVILHQHCETQTQFFKQLISKQGSKWCTGNQTYGNNSHGLR